MQVSLEQILTRARQQHYAVGAFNVYNLEGALAVLGAAEKLQSPVIVQVLPSALAMGGRPLIALCRAGADAANIPVAVHLDHCSKEQEIVAALDAGIGSVMADGSALSFEENIRFTAKMVALAKKFSAGVEAELGCLTGTEDGLIMGTDREQLTRPDQAAVFIKQTRVSALAVCIGNRHGAYISPPDLEFERLEAIAAKVSIPLVLHGTSGLPDQMIEQAVALGVCKFNVNTEVREAYLGRLEKYFATNSKKEPGSGLLPGTKPELIPLMQTGMDAMKEAVMAKIQLFGSVGRV